MKKIGNDDEINKVNIKHLIGEEIDKKDFEMTIEYLLYQKCNIVSEQGADGWEGKKTYDAIYEYLKEEPYGYSFKIGKSNYFIYVDNNIITGVE